MGIFETVEISKFFLFPLIGTTIYVWMKCLFSFIGWIYDGVCKEGPMMSLEFVHQEDDTFVIRVLHKKNKIREQTATVRTILPREDLIEIASQITEISTERKSARLILELGKAERRED